MNKHKILTTLAWIAIAILITILVLTSCDKEEQIVYNPNDSITIEVMQYDFDNYLSYALTIDGIEYNYGGYVQLKYSVNTDFYVVLHSKTKLVLRKYTDITKAKKQIIEPNRTVIISNK